MPRYTYPPVTEQFPPSCEYSKTGGTAPGASPSRKRCVPSKTFQPKLTPAPAARCLGREVDLLPRVLADVADPEVAGRPCPRRTATGCAARRTRSRAARRPCRRTGCRAGSCTPVPPLGVGSMRRILPSSVPSDWPLPPGRARSPGRPPRHRRRARGRAGRPARTRARRRCGWTAAGPGRGPRGATPRSRRRRRRPRTRRPALSPPSFGVVDVQLRAVGRERQPEEALLVARAVHHRGDVEHRLVGRAARCGSRGSGPTFSVT